MLKKLLISSLFFAALHAFAQENDPVLFEVADLKVGVSEFEYIYTKNNRDKADYSKESIEEYLDLYTRFKLKVKRAKELRLDTIQSLQNELAGYRRQLADSYLMDKEVVDKIVRQTWERMQEDVDISHILIRVKPRATPEDTLKAYEKILMIHDQLKSGASFEALAEAYSEDLNTKNEGGRMGFLTALFPQGFYALETAAYQTEPGAFSMPVRTTLGYHIVKVNARRPARGEVEAAHILVRINKDGGNAQAAKRKIQSIHARLENGASFDQLASTLSEDKASANRKGYIGPVRINMYEKDFEDAVFALEDGAYSSPVKTRVGWHIIKRLRTTENSDFASAQRKIEARIQNDERMQIAKAAMINRIKRESGLKVDKEVLNEITKKLNDSFFTYQWQLPEIPVKPLITFNDGTSASNHAFLEFMKGRVRERMRMAKRVPVADALENMYGEFEKNQCMRYEERRLEERYPEFKSLMREYEEGILLFEMTKRAVWDKASQDTAGLKAYYAKHKNNFMWGERMLVHIYTLQSGEEKQLEALQKAIEKSGPEKIMKKFNKKDQAVTYQEVLYEREEETPVPLKWQKGFVSVPFTKDSGSTEIYKVEKILPPQPKALNEARGYIIADYQDALEKEWVEELRRAYPVKVHDAVLQSLIRD